MGRAWLHQRTRHLVAAAGVFLLFGSVVWWEALPELPRSWDSSANSDDDADARRVVIIDAGHGGQDSGTVHSGIMEKDLTLDVARRLDRLLQAQNIATVLTREGDNYVSLAGRAASANRERDGLFVSIHFDEAQPRAAGVETYYAARQAARPSPFGSWLPFLQTAAAVEPNNFESQRLAAFVQDALVEKTRAVDRGTRAEQFFVIANVRHPAVLVEGGFLTNKEDVGKLTTEQYREQLARAIAEGITRYRESPRPHNLKTNLSEPRT